MVLVLKQYQPFTYCESGFFFGKNLRKAALRSQEGKRGEGNDLILQIRYPSRLLEVTQAGRGLVLRVRGRTALSVTSIRRTL